MTPTSLAAQLHGLATHPRSQRFGLICYKDEWSAEVTLDTTGITDLKDNWVWFIQKGSTPEEAMANLADELDQFLRDGTRR